MNTNQRTELAKKAFWNQLPELAETINDLAGFTAIEDGLYFASATLREFIDVMTNSNMVTDSMIEEWEAVGIIINQSSLHSANAGSSAPAIQSRGIGQ